MNQWYQCKKSLVLKNLIAGIINMKYSENTLFDDGINKYMIGYDDYIKGTEKAFYEYTLNDLYNLMPNNPKWMDGARPGAVLPLAIFDMANIEIIVPSDLNLINGVINDLD